VTSARIIASRKDKGKKKVLAQDVSSFSTPNEFMFNTTAYNQLVQILSKVEGL